MNILLFKSIEKRKVVSEQKKKKKKRTLEHTQQLDLESTTHVDSPGYKHKMIKIIVFDVISLICTSFST